MEQAKYGPQQITLSAPEGDIFWDMPPFITYIAGASIGATIYVANPSAIDREYSMLARLIDASGSLLLEEAITVYGYTWFTVKAGQFLKLHAELAYDFTDAVLYVVLVERSTDSEVDSVFTYLSAPTAAQLPPGFPGGGGVGGGGTTIAGFDFSQFMYMMMMVMMVGMVSGMFKEEEKPKQLPLGRG